MSSLSSSDFRDLSDAEIDDAREHYLEQQAKQEREAQLIAAAARKTGGIVTTADDGTMTIHLRLRRWKHLQALRLTRPISLPRRRVRPRTRQRQTRTRAPPADDSELAHDLPEAA